MQRIRLTQNLWLDEFVAPEIYQRFQGNSLIFVNPLLPKIVQSLRNYFGCVIINNWSQQGKVSASEFLDFGETKKLQYFTKSGVRSPQCNIGASYSQHKFGNAADLKFTDATPKQVRKHIIKHYKSIYLSLGLMAIEDNTNSWLHIDCRNTGSNELFIFNQ
ncbi:MAG: hypothetical protein QM503_06530 [Bacteroidota bacterium]